MTRLYKLKSEENESVKNEEKVAYQNRETWLSNSLKNQ